MTTFKKNDSLAKTLSVAVITGGHHFEVKPFTQLWRDLPGLDVFIQNLDDFTSSPPELRATYDVVVFYLMVRDGPDSKANPGFGGNPREALSQIGMSRQGTIILHHAVLAFNQWDYWDALCGMGRRLTSHYAHDVQVPLELADPKHPIVAGLKSFTLHDETYVMPEPGPGSHAILTTSLPDSMRTIGWTRSLGPGRVFCWQSGHDHYCWENPDFRRVLLQAIRWCAWQS